MSWIKLDDQFFTHPKIVDLSKDAKLLYLAALTYCGAHLTDGGLTRGALRVVAATVDVPPETAEVLLAAGLWSAADDGVQISNYLQYQPSRENALALKEARASAGRRGGYRSAAGRAQATPPAPAQADARPEGQANASAVAQANGRQIPSRLDPDSDIASELPSTLTPLPVTVDGAGDGKSRRQVARAGSRGRAATSGRAATGGRARAGPAGWTFDALWALIEAQQGYPPTWDYTVEIKAIRQLLDSFPNVQPDDLARFLRYVATCWPFREEPTRQPTFSEGARHFGAWYTHGQPAVCPAGGSQHGLRQSLAQERERANLATSDHIIQGLYAYDAGAGATGGDSGTDPAHLLLRESADSGRDLADAEGDALGEATGGCAVVPFVRRL
jgi:hypothetical protein